MSLWGGGGTFHYDQQCLSKDSGNRKKAHYKFRCFFHAFLNDAGDWLRVRKDKGCAFNHKAEILHSDWTRAETDRIASKFMSY